MDFGFQVTGLFGLIGLVLFVWAVLNIAQSTMGGLGKALWIVVLLLLPVIGFILWFFFGPRAYDRRGYRRPSY